MATTQNVAQLIADHGGAVTSPQWFGNLFLSFARLLVDTVQLHSFPFVVSTSWPTSFLGVIDPLRSMLLDLSAIAPSLTVPVFGLVVSVLPVLAFALLATLPLSQGWDLETLWHRRRAREAGIHVGWRVTTLLVCLEVLGFLLSTVLLIPLLRVSFSVFDCTLVDGRFVFDQDPTQECWATEAHFVSAVGALFAMPLLLYWAIRLGNVEGRFSRLTLVPDSREGDRRSKRWRRSKVRRVAYTATPCIAPLLLPAHLNLVRRTSPWRVAPADTLHLDPSDYHPLQPRLDLRGRNLLLNYGARIAMSFFSVMLTTRVLAVNSIFLALSLLLWSSAVGKPPFRKRRANALNVFLLSGFVYTQVIAVWTSADNGAFATRSVEALILAGYSVTGPVPLLAFAVGWLSSGLLGVALYTASAEVRKPRFFSFLMSRRRRRLGAVPSQET
jgi:hypothetical protein